MSAQNSRFTRRTRVEDYYSDDEPYHQSPSPAQQKRATFAKNRPVNKPFRPIRQHPMYDQYSSGEDDDGDEDDDELQRTMRDIRLEDFDPHNGPHGPEYFIPHRSSRFIADEDYPYPHHLVPPPPPPPSRERHPHLWYPMMDDIPRSRRSQHLRYLDLPFLHRSASARLRSRNWPNQQRPVRLQQELFLPHDEDSSDEDEQQQQQRRPSLSRQNSTASASSRGPYGRRRANSVSSMPPLPPPNRFVHSPGLRPYNSPGYLHQHVHSVPTSPLESSDEEEDDIPNVSSRRRPSLSRRGSDTMALPPRPKMGRSLSFQGFPSNSQNMPPPPPPPLPPHPSMIFPQPMPHPAMDRNNPMYSAAAAAAAAAAMAPKPGDFYDTHPPPQERNPSPMTPGDQHSRMPHPMPWPPLGSNFPGSPSNGNFAHHPPMPMMGLPMFNPVMQGPPPPLWNFISPGHDVWPGAAEFPFPVAGDPGLGQGPSPPSSQPNQEVKNEEEALQAKPESAIVPPAPEPRSMQPPVVPEPMLRRGLSFISGLFGNGAGRKEPSFRPFSVDDPMSFAHPGGFTAPAQALTRSNSKKELKKAQEYEKLGTFWCWRILPPQSQEGTAQMPAQFHFESFSIANQKLINRKISKGQTSTIFLGREKKLPGVIMIDVNQCRGCCMIKDGHFLQLELKREQFNGNGEGNRYVFHNSSAPGSW